MNPTKASDGIVLRGSFEGNITKVMGFYPNAGNSFTTSWSQRASHEFRFDPSNPQSGGSYESPT
jgi:hypothetical protein